MRSSRGMTLARLWIPLSCALLLMLTTFSAPGRLGPEGAGSLDLIALAKLGSRAITLGVLGLTLTGLWHHPRRRVVLGCLLPMGLYLGWAILSVGWSPLKSVTLGQSGGLMAQILLTGTIAMLWRAPEDTSLILCVLTVGLLGVITIILGADLISPELSGLDREGSFEDGSSGIVHPTSAAATASLGLLILLGSRLLWGWNWTRVLLVPGVLMCLVLLYVTMSRTALGMTSVLVMVMLVTLVPRPALGLMLLGGSLLGILYLIVDPGTGLLDDVLESTTGYVSRGESAESLISLTGRTELWEAIWKGYLQSPILGHGYFVTSPDGLLDVWSGPGNRTAHNLPLQVLSGTGLVGLLLFLWGMARLIWSTWDALRDRPESRCLGVLFLLIGTWYLGWTQLCASFMGPVQPESVVFFVLAGLALGQVRPRKGAMD